MSDPKTMKIKPVKKTNYSHTETSVYKVEGDPIDVAPGDTVEILIPGSEGFSVYLPIGGHFDAQVYEAVENPAWAMEEMAGEGGGSEVSSKTTFWGVRMTRTSKAGAYPEVVFPYCIYNQEIKNFAIGKHSPPTMNLKP